MREEGGVLKGTVCKNEGHEKGGGAGGREKESDVTREKELMDKKMVVLENGSRAEERWEMKCFRTLK